MRRRVFARPGAITSALRRVWGLESLKKADTGERKPDDRHHALDAIVTACCSESLLHRATRHAQIQENRGEKFELRTLPSPWGENGEFRRDVEQAFQSVFVSRPERGRLRGKGHHDTIKQIRTVDDGEVLFERKSVVDLKLADLDRIPIPKPYGKVVDPAKLRDLLVENLRNYIIERDGLNEKIKQAEAKSQERKALQKELSELARPLSPKGDVIKKVRLPSKAKKAVTVRGGSAGQFEMVRVDVFTKPNKKGKDEYYLVPIYRSDVFTDDEALMAAPPNRAVVAKEDSESNWPVMDETFRFKFSLCSFSLVEMINAEGEVMLGYFRSLDRGENRISFTPHEQSTSNPLQRTGAKTLLSFKKFHVDRLGNVSEVKQEKRTWRGKVCT